MNTALLLLEIQNDYFPQGKMPLGKSIEASLKAQVVLEAAREKKLPIAHLQHISTRPDATFLLPCTKGAEFHPNAQPAKGEAIIKKHYPNSFKDTSLLTFLTKNKVKHLLVCGMMTHLTVDATVRAAYDLGFSCTIIHDACAAIDLEFNQTPIAAEHVHHAFLAALQPTYGSLMSADHCVQKLGARARAVAV